jgi:hypothetical protein
LRLKPPWDLALADSGFNVHGCPFLGGRQGRILKGDHIMDKNIEKAPVETLQGALEQITKDVEKEDWIDMILAAIKQMVDNNPMRYRQYGPYWWLIKKALIEREDLSFEDTLDLEWIEALDYGDTALNLMAAFLYGDEKHNLGLLTESFHTMHTPDGSVEYACNDAEIELRATFRK